MSISVIIPAYNYAAYLGEAIESVLHQTRPVQEVLVVDDGSTDETSQVVASFGGRVRYLYQPNRGLPAARNTGIRVSTGTWLAFLDADDWWLPEKIRLQVRAVERDPEAALVYGSIWLVEPDGERSLALAVDPGRLWPELRYHNIVCGSGSAVLVRKDVVLETGGFDERLTACEDWDLWVRLALRYRFAAVQEPIAAVRLHPRSMSAASHERMLANWEKILERTLLHGLQGWERLCWRRRIRSAGLYHAAIAARSADLKSARKLLWQSVLQWPLPFFMPVRWAVFAHSLLVPKRYARLAFWRKSSRPCAPENVSGCQSFFSSLYGRFVPMAVVKQKLKNGRTVMRTSLAIGGKSEGLARILYGSGFICLLEHLPKRPSLTVLTYHRVGKPDQCPYDRGVFDATPDQFDRQIAYLKSHFPIVGLEEAQHLVERPSLIRHACVLITFDDGYLDNYEVVFPILKSHNVQGTFFLATSFIGTDHLPWWDLIAFLVRQANGRTIVLNYPRPLRLDLSLTNTDAAIAQLLSVYKSTETLDTAHFLAGLAQAFGTELPQKTQKRLFMDWDEARIMAQAGMAFGSHTHRHEILARLLAQEQARDLRRSQEILQSELHVAADALAYPVGSLRSFSTATCQLLREAGYKTAFSYYGGVNLPQSIQPFNVRRMGVDLTLSSARFRLLTLGAAIIGKDFS